MNAAVEASYRAAERVTADWARSFYFASRFLPDPKRRAVFAIYDYCRHADNLVDGRGSRPASLARQDLARLAEQVRELHAGGPAPEYRWLALADTLQRFEVPLAPLLELLDGVAEDLEPDAVADFATLYEYCRKVAGGVGLMLGPVLGASGGEFEAHGVDLGIAMQLTNVLRDVAEDLDEGRLYLPADELAAHGVSRADLERRVMSPALRLFVIEQVRRARYYFSRGDAVVPLFPTDGSRLTVRLLQRTYAGILDRIEARNFDLFRGRASTSPGRKFLIMARAVLDERWSRTPHLSTHSA